MAEPANIADVITSHLAVHLGPHVAKIAVKTFAQRSLGLTPEQLRPSDVPQLLDSLRPMLVTMLGKESSAAVVAEITRALQ